MRDDLQFCVEFIQEVENNPQIYDQSLPDYSNRRVTEQLWAKIGIKFKESGVQCKDKWKKIRSSFIRSLNTKGKSGSAAGSKKEYYLAPYLRFLTPFTKSRKHEGNIPISHDEASNSVDDQENVQPPEMSNDSYIETNTDDNTDIDISNIISDQHQQDVETIETSTHEPLSTSKARGYVKPLSAVDKCAIEYFTMKRKRNEVTTLTKQQPDSCELFLLSIVPHMQSMTSRQQLLFQKGVLDLIEKFAYNNTTEHPVSAEQSTNYDNSDSDNTRSYTTL